MNRYQNEFKPLALAIGLVVAVMTGCSGGSGGSSSGISLLAGNMDGDGSLDGAGAKASVYRPTAMVSDSAGNLYVADSGNNTIRKITSAGVVTTLAGTAGVAGFADGAGAAASFDLPRGLAVDSTGTNLYVADKNNQTIRKIVIVTGVVTTLAGSAGNSGYVNNPDPTVARFSKPTSLAMDGSGNLYVGEARYNYTVRKITPAGAVTTVAGAPRSGTGSGTKKDANGTGVAAGFGPIAAMAVDSAGSNLYLANVKGDTIRKVVIATGVATTHQGLPHAYCCGGGSTDDPGALGGTATFKRPHGLAIDSAGTLYVADKTNNTIRKITLAGAVTTLAGTAGVTGDVDGTGAAASFNRPAGLALNSNGTKLYVAEMYGQAIRKVDTATGAVTTLAGTPAVTGAIDGSKTAATFSHTNGVALDSAGNLYVADAQCTIRKITSGGEVSTFIGTAGTCAGTDGTGAWASFTRPLGLAIDSNDNLYVADKYNGSVRKVTPASVVTTLATGFNTPHDLAVDNAGNVYVADSSGNISKVTPAGAVSIYAAGLSAAHGLAFDSAGNLYVAEGNKYGTNTINKIDSGGTVTLFAGSGAAGSADGTGAVASFNDPHGLVIDSNDNLYVADRRNNTIRKITPAGVVTTVAGMAPPNTGYRGTGTRDFKAGALPGLLPAPRFLAIKGKTLYVTARHGVVKVALP